MVQMKSDIAKRIADAVDLVFDAQLATTRDFVAIPSTRSAEGPCQDMIGDLLRERGYEVDDWQIDLGDLRDLRGFGPVETDFSRARSVVGTYRPTNGRKVAHPAGSLRCRADRSARYVGHAAILACYPRRQDVWPRRLRHEVGHHRRALCA